MGLFPAEADQKFRFRRSLMAAGAALVLTAIVWVAGEFRMVRLYQTELIWLLSVFWVVNLAILACLRSGLNLRFSDPSLTMAQIFWATSCVMYITYYLNEARAAALMICILVMNFSAFRLNLAQLITVAVFASGSYALVIYLLYTNHPDIFGLQIELFILAGFAAALFGSTIVGHEMYTLRAALRDRNRRLEFALERMNLLAVTDEVTGAYNRHFLSQVLTQQMALAVRGGYKFSLVFMDLDHFKRINDEFGHAAGDNVLAQLAEIANTIIREGDYLIRYGGEEFVLLLANTNVDGAETLAERLRKTVAESSFEDIAPGMRLTVSCGATGFKPGESADDLIARADRAMYQAKENGRNSVVRI